MTDEMVTLREVVDGDLEPFFENQRDADAARAAGVPSRDREAFFAHWQRIRANDTGLIRTVLADGVVAGNVLSFVKDGRREVGYWIGREFWGRGVATQALAAFLEDETTRPLYAFVVRGNPASVRVLEKCGFTTLEHEDEGTVFILGG